MYYGFPRKPAPSVHYRRVSIDTNATAKQYLLPALANAAHTIRVFKAVAGGGYSLVDPTTYGLLQSVDWSQDVTQPGMTVTSNGSNPQNVIDNTDSVWAGPYATSGQYFTIDLGVPALIVAARCKLAVTEGYRYTTAFNVYGANSSTPFNLVRSYTTPTTGTFFAVSFSTTIPMRYWQFSVTAVNTVTATAWYEVELFMPDRSQAISGLDFNAAPGAGSLLIEFVGY
ncbi:MAG: discoidin domain-containing protein [Chloroflexales bacterium]|nr:discoidin domain-containing protein [Chloroflexales bacterium]